MSFVPSAIPELKDFFMVCGFRWTDFEHASSPEVSRSRS
jgi:hypothetical protein